MIDFNNVIMVSQELEAIAVLKGDDENLAVGQGVVSGCGLRTSQHAKEHGEGDKNGEKTHGIFRHKSPWLNTVLQNTFVDGGIEDPQRGILSQCHAFGVNLVMFFWGCSR